MKPITTAAACFILVIHLPGHSHARNWDVEVEGSCSVTQWDNEGFYWEEATTRAYKARVSGSYWSIQILAEYMRASFDASGIGYEYDVDRDDILAFLGYRLLTNLSIALCLTYRHIKGYTEADSRAYGAYDFDMEEIHRIYGFGLLASQALRATGITVFGRAMYFPWGMWTSERQGVMANWEPYELELEDDTPTCYGGELGIEYRLRWFNASVEASWTFLNHHIEYDYPCTSFHHEHDERWQDLALGLSYEF